MTKTPGYQFYYGVFHGCMSTLAGVAASYGNWFMAALAVIIAIIGYASFLSRLYGSQENSERVGSDY